MNWNELLKYPIMVASIFLALFGARHLLDFDIGRATRIGADGIEFAEQQERTSEATQALDQALKEALARIEVLENSVNNPSANLDATERKRILEASAQEVSPEVAMLARSTVRDGKSLVYGKVGYIWIGDYQREWLKPRLVGLDGQVIEKAPQAIEVGERYSLRANIVLRKEQPQNNAEYYRGSPSLGVVTSGTQVQIEARPTGIDREFAVQYWAKVKVME